MLQRPIRYLLSVTEHGSFTRAAAIAAILEIVRLAGLATILPEAMAREQSGLCVVRRKSPIDPRGAALLPRLGGLPQCCRKHVRCGGAGTCPGDGGVRWAQSRCCV
jgi:hypothetical protein